jgi:hypothetical protein
MKRIVRLGQTTLGVMGVLGTLTCMGAMVLAIIGVAGVGVSASMGGMSPGGQSGSGGQPIAILALLLAAGPTILLISIGAFTLSLATRRWGAAILALLLGSVIYWGMYSQPRLPVMYITMVLGLLGWAVLFLWVRGPFHRRVSSRL